MVTLCGPLGRPGLKYWFCLAPFDWCGPAAITDQILTIKNTTIMKPILIFQWKHSKLANGKECTPYYTQIDFFGNLFFKKQAFTHKWLFFNGTVLHILGFRFVKGISTHREKLFNFGFIALAAQGIYSLFYWLDKKMGYVEPYDYETAPYCGHHYNGHDGRFTCGHYHEGEGGETLKTTNPFFKIGYSSFDGWHWGAPRISVKRTLFDKDMKRVFKSDDIYYGIRGIRNCLKSTNKAKSAGFKAKLVYGIR